MSSLVTHQAPRPGTTPPPGSERVLGPGAAEPSTVRILVLTAATGGGHDMRAGAMCDWTVRLTPWRTEICRPLEEGNPIYRWGGTTYNRIQRHAPVLHHVYFGFLEHAALHASAGRILGAGHYLATLDSVRPDVIVSTHAHLNHGYFELARRRLGRSNVRCVTYCGELGGGYGFSRHWVNPDADLFIGAVDETVHAAVALGMPEGRAWRGGFLLRPGFHDEQPDTDRVRHFVEYELGFDADRFVLLLATGAAGANNHARVLRFLESRGKSLQVVALCGHREKTFDDLNRWSSRAKNVKLQCLRYRTDMPMILRSASAVVARPGTGTVSEAIVCGCPIMLNGVGGIMPQESVTLRFALQHGIANRIRAARDIGEVLDRWELDPSELGRIKRAMHSVRQSLRPRDIIEKATGCPVEDNGDSREHT
jgi:processive 1,2-diacylglycerol beta-glucosyltransferase